MDLEIICRLCLAETTSDASLESSISKDFQELFNLDVILNFDLPTRVCSACLETSDKFFQFTELVRANQEKLLELRKIKKPMIDEAPPERASTIDVKEESEDESNFIDDFPVRDEDDYKEEIEIYKEKTETTAKTTPKPGAKKKKAPLRSPPKTKKIRAENEEPFRIIMIGDGIESTESEDKRISEFFDLSCSECSIKYDKFAVWKAHARYHGDENPGIICCDKKMTRRHQILSHIAVHKNPVEFSCNECGKIYKSKSRLKEHISIYHKGKADQYECEHCPRKFSTKSSLKQHQLNHISDEEKQRLKSINTCTECGLGFLSRAKMLHHIRFQHALAYSTVCSACGKSFKSKYNFLIHYQNAHGEGVGRPQCSVCGMVLSDDSSLRRHMRNKHNNTGDYTCSVCSKKCPSQNALKAHVEYVHSKQRKYSCQYCDKSFKRPIGLKEHLTTHVGGALYQCTFCEKTFNSGANMYSHRKRAHPNELKALKEQEGKSKLETVKAE